MNLSFSFFSHSSSSTSLHVCLARKSFSNCSTTASRSIVEPDESFVRHLLRLVCANCAFVVVVVVICCCYRHLLLSESGRAEEKERLRDRERMRACSKQLLGHCYCCCCIREISEYPVDDRGESSKGVTCGHATGMGVRTVNRSTKRAMSKPWLSGKVIHATFYVLRKSKACNL